MQHFHAKREYFLQTVSRPKSHCRSWGSNSPEHTVTERSFARARCADQTNTPLWLIDKFTLFNTLRYAFGNEN
jgi:hypothetical protein